LHATLAFIFYVFYVMYHPLLCLAEASRLGHLFIKIGYVCQENREGANLCSMHLQADILTTKQQEDVFSLSLGGKQGKEDTNMQYSCCLRSPARL